MFCGQIRKKEEERITLTIELPNSAQYALGIHRNENPVVEINFINLFQNGDAVALTVGSIIERQINLHNGVRIELGTGL